MPRPLSEITYPTLVGSSKSKPHTKFKVPSFTRFGDIVEDMPNFIGVTWLRPHPFSEIIYLDLVVSTKTKPYTKYEVSSLTGFRNIIEGMPNFLGSHDLGHAPFHKCYMLYFLVVERFQGEVVYQIRSWCDCPIPSYDVFYDWYVSLHSDLDMTFWPWTVTGNFLSCDLRVHQLWAS